MNDYFLKAFGRQSTINVKTQIEEEFTEVFFKELATARSEERRVGKECGS